MSTKTTFKRVALVAVAALGLGMMSAVPSSAVAVVGGATSDFSTNTSSITLVDATATSNSTGYGIFEVSLANSDGIAAPLLAGESLTATVISSPQPSRVSTATVIGNLDVAWATAWAPATRLITTAGTGALTSHAAAGAILGGTVSATLGAAYNDLNLGTAFRGGIATTSSYVLSTSAATATYALQVSSNSANTIDSGFYVIRIRVLDSGTNTIASHDVKFQVVSSKSTSGAVLTATSTGSQATAVSPGLALTATTVSNLSATITDVNGGYVREGLNVAPTLTASVKDKGSSATPAVYITDSVTFSDLGVTAIGAADTDLTQVIKDGVYEALTGSLTGLAGTGTLTVRYGDASATASVVMTGTTGTVFMNTSVSATGKVAKTTNFDVPLTTKAASVTATAYSATDITLAGTTAVPSQVMYYTLAYSGCVLGDMLPAAKSAATKVTANANGQYAIDITNANPISGCSATVVFSGASVATIVSSTTTASLTRVINWTAPVATSVVVSPAGDYEAVALSTHKFTWTITDQFSAPIVGSTVQFSMSGANKPATGSSVPSAITDANGQVSYTFTDAAGVPASTTLGTTSVGLSTVGVTPFAMGTRTITYKASITALASLYATYTSTNAATVPLTITGVVPTTAIGGTTGVPVSSADVLDTTKVLTGTSAAPYVALNFTAKTAAGTATSGVPTTVTVTGAKLIGSDGKLASTVTVYANENVYILGTTTGVATVTATNGTLTSTATINFVNAATDARVLKLTEASGLVTASVTDAFGNAVKGVAVDVVGSGGAWLGNGSTSAAFNTATDGTVTFSVTGSGTVSASLSSTAYAKASNLAGAGNSTGSVITTGAPAGVRSASVATTGYNVTSDAAQAASDAAAEATDAANAATDAANAAAEAADAATAAAQDAADAVAALSTQVSEMIDALKKQITALTNLVIKIQKKVKA